ncbi:MAG TPA: L,D-transpeptidase family protein [Anaerohalosphaeraceae bacterium]|nr:L,D-transpeptidase family protein [Anaerohalosphaeraceae bacterium]HRT49387.1 L,D-transpeptidase family protein [Anaerohalosphaeraceae bacterium]HRT87380.1 L,D-transpeptidase family protein [Anaerohalosphaeraceae bacterium]
MAKYEYKPLSSAKRRNSNARNLIISLVVALMLMIGGTVKIMRTYGSDPGAAGSSMSPDSQSSEVPVLPPETSNPAAGAAAAAQSPVVPPKNTGADTGSARAAPASTTDNVQVLFDPVPPSTTTMSQATLSQIEQALKQLEAGHIIAARDGLNAVLGREMTPEYRASVKKKMAELAQVWLFSNTVFPGDTLTEMYTVRPGEVLSSIGKKFNVPHEILQKINGIDRPERLQAGQKIKVIKGPFHVKVYLSTFTMDLYLGSQMFVKSYRVGLGAMESETPPGRWRVKAGGKLIQPKWTHPVTHVTYSANHPEYPLGSRWIAIEGLDESNRHREGFAIHGTKEPETIGTRSSMGCIRLYNGDVIEIYGLLVEQKSEVRIVD